VSIIDRNTAMKIRQAILEGRERSVFAFKHDTVNLSFMYIVYRPLYWSEVEGFINIITVFAWHTGLAKEDAGIDEQKN